MKIVALSLTAIGATGSAWAWLGPDLAAPIEPPEVSQARATAGARLMLSDHPHLDVRNLVLGVVHPSGTFDFRGRLMQGGRLRPAYGQVKPICTTDQERPSCWTLAHIEIDGQPVTDLHALVSPEPEEEPRQVAEAPRPKESEPLAGGVAFASTAVPEKTDDPKPEPDRSATHRVARPIINARSGPGTDHPIVAKLKGGVLLEMLESDEEWGRFIVIDSAEAGAQVWAALRILEEVE